MCGLLEYFHIFVHSLIFLPIRSFLPHPLHWWFRAIPICNGTTTAALSCCTPVRLIQHAVGAEGHWRRPTVLESTKLASSLPPSVLCPAPPLASLPSPSGGAGHCCRPTMMEPAGRCGTRRLPAAGAAPPVDSSGSSRKVGWRKVGRRPRHWWGRLQGFGAGWRPVWASSIPAPALLPPTWPPHQQVTSLSPDQGQGTGSTHGCSNTSGHSAFWLHWQNRLVRSFASSVGAVGRNWSITAQASPRWRHRSEMRGPGRFPLGEVSGERFPRRQVRLRPLVSRSFSPRYPNTLALSSNPNMNQYQI